MAKQGGTVYVIDDDESVRRSLLRLLRSANLIGEAFPSAEEFLNQPRQCKNACLLVDLRMPGISGFGLQESLLSQGVDIPVIVISASDDAKTRERARELGAVVFFRKPVDDQALLDAILWAITGNTKH